VMLETLDLPNVQNFDGSLTEYGSLVPVASEKGTCNPTGSGSTRRGIRRRRRCARPAGASAFEPSPYDPLPKEVFTDECDR